MDFDGRLVKVKQGLMQVRVEKCVISLKVRVKKCMKSL